jgi:flavin reductase (DIM6/NTAB) family NADH-FMN oxidoreductase RutF/pimeloyl-ACP methyl ester carboxylesterase
MTPSGSTIVEFRGSGGVKLRGEAFGSPDHPPVLLLPAGGQHHRSLIDAARALGAAGRYAICLDLRGHGISDWASTGEYTLEAYVDDIRLVLQQFDQRPVLIAMALSGINAVIALGETKDAACSGLVLIGVSERMNRDEMRAAVRLLETQSDGFETVGEAVAARRALRPFEQPQTDIADELRTGDDGRLYWHWDPRMLGGFDTGRALIRFHAALKNIRAPTLIVRGGLSQLISVEAAEQLQAMIPNAELVNLEQAGHLAATDDRDGFNAALLEFLERRVPREPIAYETGADSRTLRDALGCYGTGITVVTAFSPEGDPIGFTANSFTSVSLDPPLLLFCLANSSKQLRAFQAAQRFAINVLHIGQQPDSVRFASRVENRFEGVDWCVWEDSAPILNQSLASFDCIRHAEYDAGDHRIFVGRVLRASFEPRRDPLLYFRGKYRRLHYA